MYFTAYFVWGTWQVQRDVFFFTSIISFIGAQLLYNVVLVSAVQWSESAEVYIYPLPPEPPSSPSHPSRSSQSTELSSLCRTAASHVVVCIHQCYSLHLCHLLLPGLCPQVCSLSLCLQYCPANRFISTLSQHFIRKGHGGFYRVLLAGAQLAPHAVYFLASNWSRGEGACIQQN